MIQSPVILHLSDIHFGNTDRYENPELYQTFFEKTAADLDSFKYSGLVPNIIIVSGDLSQNSLPEEYQHVHTFLENLSAHTNIPKERIVIVPGNHDVNWDLCKAARLRANVRGIGFQPPYFEKFEVFKEFYDRFYSGLREFSSKLYEIYNMNQYGILIVGFNSCVKESETDHYGWIGFDQVENARKECDKIAPASKLLRIAVMHHNFRRLSENNSENLLDAEAIRPALEAGGFRLLVHGHKHFQDLLGLRNLETNFEHVILSTGSAGLDRIPSKGVACQYQLITIEPNEITLCLRQYSTTVVNETGQGKWVPDSSRFESGTGKIHTDWINKIEAFSIPLDDKEPEDEKITGKQPKIGFSIRLMGTVDRDLVQQVISKINSIQSSFEYRLEDKTIELGPSDTGDAYSYSSLFLKTLNIKTHVDTEYDIFVLDRPIEGNWFGFWWPDRGFLTISDWENFFAPPSVTEYIAYYIANITLFFLTKLENHVDTRSCLKDFCREKNDIKRGMWSGQLCFECSKKIQAVIGRGEMTEIQYESIQEILNMVRDEYRRQ